MKRHLLPIIMAAVVAAAPVADAAVDLEWRPSVQVAYAGDSCEIGLYAVSDSGSPAPISAVDVTVLYDPAYLLFDQISAAGAPYTWLSDGFFSPSPDGINDSLIDGDILYTAFAQLGQPAIVTPEGLLVTTFRFDAEQTGQTEVTIPALYGNARTRVFDATTPNNDIKGDLGSATVYILQGGGVVYSSIGEMKQQPDGTLVEVSGPAVTRSFAEGPFFYLEDASRAAGIRVNTLPLLIPPEGTAPTVSGTLATVDGERVIDNALVVPGPAADIPVALGMNIRTAHGPALDPQGLLVRLWGTVSSPTEDSFVLDDGSLDPVLVELHGVAAPASGSYVIVTGALGGDAEGPVLRVNNTSDIAAAGP